MSQIVAKSGNVPVKEAAERMGTSQVMVRYLIDTKQMPGLVKENKQRTTYLIPRGQFEDWLSRWNQ